MLTNETFRSRVDGDHERRASSSYLFGVNRAARTVTTELEALTDYYVADRHGSTVALTNDSGVQTTTYDYTDYGSITERRKNTDIGSLNKQETRVDGFLSNPFQYSGEYANPDDTQLLGSRIYNPVMMVFSTRDTAPLYNRYAYGSANPVTRVDPSGQSAEPDSVSHALLVGTGVIASLLSAGMAMAAASALVGEAVSIGCDVALIMNESRQGALMSERTAQGLLWAGVGFAALAALAIAPFAAVRSTPVQEIVDSELPLIARSGGTSSVTAVDTSTWRREFIDAVGKRIEKLKADYQLLREHALPSDVANGWVDPENFALTGLQHAGQRSIFRLSLAIRSGFDITVDYSRDIPDAAGKLKKYYLSNPDVLARLDDIATSGTEISAITIIAHHWQPETEQVEKFVKKHGDRSSPYNIANDWVNLSADSDEASF